MSSVIRTKKSLITVLAGVPLSVGLVACGAGEEVDGMAATERSTVTSTTSADKPEESDDVESSEEPTQSEQADAAEGTGTADDESADGKPADKEAAGEKTTGDRAPAVTEGKPARSASAPKAEAEESTGDPAVIAEVEAAVQNQFDGAHYANMATLWDHTQRSTCASALAASQQEAKQAMAQELPVEMQGLDVFAMMDDPNVGPIVRQELVNQPAPAAPTLNSIDSVTVDGGRATVQLNSTTGGQSADQTLNFVNEDGAWKVCA